MTAQKRRILVTSALPYANGPLHLGHLLEHIQTDIWVRFHKLLGHECYYVCGDDAHGTPIMLQAQKQNITPEALIEAVLGDHKVDLAAFQIEYDNYYTTHSPENRALSEAIYHQLLARGDIKKRTIEQMFDPEVQMFLPDRFIKGSCPRCHTSDQNGDNCEQCGATYSPLELLEPRSALSQARPVIKESEHHFFQLQNYQTLLEDWLSGNKIALQPEVWRKLQEWFTHGLKDWDISRDAPYFGFEIPNEPHKYFYVWLDAPIGYMASFKQFCDNTQQQLHFSDFWQADSACELYHFIGKDIVYFHALFWPAVLHGSQFRIPSGLFVHGFLTVNGLKMSKSRGTFITAKNFLKVADPQTLRYYFAAKTNQHVEDLDLNLDDFTQRVNADLINKFVNIASRASKLLAQHFDHHLAQRLDDAGLYHNLVELGERLIPYYAERDFARVVRSVMDEVDKINAYFDQHKPWHLIKDASHQQKVQEICTTALNLFRLCVLYLSPILPQLSLDTAALFDGTQSWQDRHAPLTTKQIKPYKALLQRLDKSEIYQMLDHSSEAPQAPVSTAATASFKPEIQIDDFAKIDLRVASIVKAEIIPEADKLLRLELDLGDSRRQVFAGIKRAYTPESLIGRQVIVVANLAPRKMRFGLSEGMVLAAGPGGEDIFLSTLDAGAKPGMPVK